MQTVNRARALEVLEQAMLTQGPDFIYNQDGGLCFYHAAEPQEAPGENNPKLLTPCLIGVAFGILGIEILPWWEGTKVGIVIQGLNRGGAWHFTAAASAVFRHAQLAQDGGQTWGVALDAGRHYSEGVEDL